MSIILAIDDAPSVLKLITDTLGTKVEKVEVAKTAEEGLNKAVTLQPDIILLDFLLPDMNAFQFCEKWQHLKKDKEIPIVIMSNKGDIGGKRIVERLGIVDYINKPLTPESIEIVSFHVLSKYIKKLKPEHIIEKEEEGEDVRIKLETSAFYESRRKITQKILDELVKEKIEYIQLVKDYLKFQDKLKVTIENSLTDDFIATLSKDLWKEELTSEMAGENISLEGDMESIPIAEIFQLLTLQNQTGILLLVRDKSKIMVFFRKGNIDFATGKNVDKQLLLGRFLLEARKVTPPILSELLLMSKKQGVVLGELVVKKGYVTQEELYEILKNQTCELIYYSLRWTSGRFYFASMNKFPTVVEEASFGIPAQNILMEGYRQVDEWHLIEKEIDSFDLVLYPNPLKMTDKVISNLTKEEQEVLHLVDGLNSVKDIINKSHLRPFEVCKNLYTFLSSKIIVKGI